MAKAGFWLRGAKGTLAGTVLQKGSSGTVIREKVDPVNVKAPGQVEQRAAFAVAAKFFKLCQSKFFQFAYDDRRNGESFYNTFMRKNISLFAPVRKEIIDSQFFCPCVDGVMMTQGSLGTYETRTEQDGITGGTMKWTAGLVLPHGSDAIDAYLEGLGEKKATIGALWKTLIDANRGLHNGDYITILGLPKTHENNFIPNSDLTQEEYAPNDESIRSAVDAVFFLQLKVDVNDKTEFEDYMSLPFGLCRTKYSDEVVIGAPLAITKEEIGLDGKATVSMWTAVLSRNDASGFSCSTAFLVNNDIQFPTGVVSDVQFYKAWCTEFGAVWTDTDPYFSLDMNSVTPNVKYNALREMDYDVATPAVLQGNSAGYRQ